VQAEIQVDVARFVDSVAIDFGAHRGLVGGVQTLNPMVHRCGVHRQRLAVHHQAGDPDLAGAQIPLPDGFAGGPQGHVQAPLGLPGALQRGPELAAFLGQQLFGRFARVALALDTPQQGSPVGRWQRSGRCGRWLGSGRTCRR